MKFVGFIIIIIFLMFIVYKIDTNTEKIEMLNKNVSELNIINKNNNHNEFLIHINNAEKYINKGDSKKAIEELEKIKKLSSKENIDSNDLYDNLKENINNVIKEKIIEKLSK